MSRQLIPVISLFSGPGGMDLGFRQQGFWPIVAIDISQSAVKTYNWNAKRRIAQQQDLSKLSDGDIVRLIRNAAPDIKPCGVIGGPPCQSFSLSNVHKKRNDPRQKLPFRYAEILKVLNQEFNLDFFVFENVPGLKSNKHSKYFQAVLKAFADAGFEIFEQELDARKFGVAQKRRRVFVVGINKNLYPNLKFEFPTGGEGKVITVKDVIGKLPKPTFFRRNIERKEISRHPNHWTMNPKSAKFKNGSDQNGRSFRRLKWNEPSWTVAYGHREIHIHPGGKRRVSIFEAMLLQGFPESYELRGNLTQQVTQVSDAVPPPLASAVAEAIKEIIYKRRRNIQTHLLNWFKKNQRSFPWRETRDPYKVLLAEKLLQQTAAREKVVAAYNEIVHRYPSIEALAMAQPEQLKPIIAPLGFVYRADELPRLAQEILNREHGEIPTVLNELLALPGVGDYSARAMLAFAHNHNVPIVDTNVARFLYRIYGIAEPLPQNPARNKRLIEMAQTLIPEGNARDFNLAVLDLCSSVCKIKNPGCDKCPVQSYCLFRKLKLEDRPNTETT